MPTTRRLTRPIVDLPIVDVLYSAGENENVIYNDPFSDEPLVTLQQALLFYVFMVIAVTLVAYYACRLALSSAFIFSIIVGQIMLTVVYMPIYIDFWAEFDSAIAIYSLIQLLTPPIVFIYAIYHAAIDKQITY